MAYCPLVNRFTQGQKDRITATLMVEPRTSLLSSIGCGPVSINESNSLNVFSVYPNPANNQINVKTDAKFLGSVYVVYDNTGKLVLTGKITSENTVIELGNLSAGIYLLSAGENSKHVFKVIKE